jgi:hypothetical protein
LAFCRIEEIADVPDLLPEGIDGLDGFLGGLALVGRQIVQDDDIAFVEGWCELLLDIGLEDAPVHRGIDDEGGGAAVSNRGNLSDAHLQCGGGGHPRGLAAGSNRRHKKIVAIETGLLRLLRIQKKLGQVAEADVALQEAALAQAEETLPPLEKQLAQQRDLLTALAGRYPSEEVVQKFTLESLKLPHELPVSLPSKVVEQRPDVRAASATLHSTSAAIGVAIANLCR